MPSSESPLSSAPIGLNPLEGQSVILVRANPDYLDFIHDIYTNNDFMDLYRLSQDRALPKTELKDRLQQEATQLPQNLKRIEWVIIKKSPSENNPIGLAAIADYQIHHNRAELLLGISAPSERHTLHSLETALLVLDFAFNIIRLHKLISYVYGYNLKAQKNTLHLGFTQEALLKEHYFTPQGFIDLYQNRLLEQEFRSNNKLAKLSLRLLGRDITQKNRLKTEVLGKQELDHLTSQLKKSLRT